MTPTPDPVHLLRGREKNVVSTRCGVETKVKGTDGLPADVTGWQSAVTCPDCVSPPGAGLA